MARSRVGIFSSGLMLVVFNTDGIWLMGYGQEEVVYDLGDEWGYSREVGKGPKAQKDGLISLMKSSTSFCEELSGRQSTTVGANQVKKKGSFTDYSNYYTSNVKTISSGYLMKLIEQRPKVSKAVITAMGATFEVPKTYLK